MEPIARCDALVMFTILGLTNSSLCFVGDVHNSRCSQLLVVMCRGCSQFSVNPILREAKLLVVFVDNSR